VNPTSLAPLTITLLLENTTGTARTYNFSRVDLATRALISPALVTSPATLTVAGNFFGWVTLAYTPTVTGDQVVFVHCPASNRLRVWSIRFGA
jgi:hypothetical protein